MYVNVFAGIRKQMTGMQFAPSPAVPGFPANLGKRVSGNIYLHLSAWHLLPSEWLAIIEAAASLSSAIPGDDFNVVKLDVSGDEVSLLSYPGFFDEPFPTLSCSWRVRVSLRTWIFRTYEESQNPPVLHRKELLLAPGDERIPNFAELTRTAETLGLFDAPQRIGLREYWYALIKERGYELVGTDFVPLANVTSSYEYGDCDVQASVSRHLTALTRSNFSAPVQALLRHGLLGEGQSFFDYGCGRADDMRGLREIGVMAEGWDPHFLPDGERQPADVVNLGFVINVIEDIDERIRALQCAYDLTRSVLSIGAMLSSSAPTDGRAFKDGYLSSRNTFQKYFTQGQLREFIEHTLDDASIAVGPGVFLVFKNKALEQNFLATRYGRRAPRSLVGSWSRPRVSSDVNRRPSRADQRFEENREALEALWRVCLELGRMPEREEVPSKLVSALEDAVGSLGKALRIVFSRLDTEAIERAAQLRRTDLIVFLGIQQFQKRRRYREFEPTMQRDIKAFFGNFENARSAAQEALFQIADPELLDAACRDAANKGFGLLEDSHSLQLHVSLIGRLPGVLRIYVESALVVFGDLNGFDLVKIHIRSGKVTLLRYESFVETPLPRLIQRVKIRLRVQDFDVFDYGEAFPPPLLFQKSRFINEEFPNFEAQLRFEEALDSTLLFDFDSQEPSEQKFFQVLGAHRLHVNGFELERSRNVPDLDESCGRYFTYRAFVECGETQQRIGLTNLPREPDTYTALFDMAKFLLDPVVDYFGMIRLTYGFCSRQLAREIAGRIAPELDQHACCERKRNGELICNRLGAAADFLVEDEDMEEVAKWVIENLPFDRLYFYGRDRPIHVSYGPDHSRSAYRMERSPSGRLIPKLFGST